MDWQGSGKVKCLYSPQIIGMHEIDRNGMRGLFVRMQPGAWYLLGHCSDLTAEILQ
jgi:hypothetical protein